MKKSGLSTLACSVARAIEAVGDGWSLMVVRELFLGSRRFEEFLAQTDISPHLLSVRLKRLEAAGIVRRERYAERPARHLYKLTEKGRDLWPVIVALKGWGDRWLDGGDGPPMRLRHTACGCVTQPAMACTECGAPLDAFATEVEMGPAMAMERELRAAKPGLSPSA